MEEKQYWQRSGTSRVLLFLLDSSLTILDIQDRKIILPICVSGGKRAIIGTAFSPCIFPRCPVGLKLGPWIRGSLSAPAVGANTWPCTFSAKGVSDQTYLEIISYRIIDLSKAQLTNP
jgi:hypothetical protein